MSRLPAARLELRLLAARDAGLYAALYGDPETMRHVGVARDPAQLARGFAATCRANTQTPPLRRTWVIVGPATGTDVGLIGLIWDAPGDGGHDRAELGVVLPPAQQGRGIATAAIAAVADHAFAALALRVLHTRHDDDHALAAGLMAGLGFERIASAAGRMGWRWELTPARWQVVCARRRPAGDPLP